MSEISEISKFIIKKLKTFYQFYNSNYKKIPFKKKR